MAKPGKPQQGSAVKVVEALVRPVVEAMGLRLWDVRFEKEGPDWFLRVLIDRDEPMDTDTCAEVSHAIDPLLDEADPIDQSYYLEVGSPGMGRRLTRPEHYEQLKGQKCAVRLVDVQSVRDFARVVVTAQKVVGEDTALELCVQQIGNLCEILNLPHG